MKKSETLVGISHRSDSDGNAIDCEIACDCVKWPTWSYVKKFMLRFTQSPTGRLLLSE